MAKIGHYPTENSQKLKRTDLGVELIRLLSSEGHAIFSIEQAREFSPRIGLKESYLRESLYHLRRNGWLLPLRRGLYAISPTVPGVTPSHEFVIAMALVEQTGNIWMMSPSGVRRRSARQREIAHDA